MIRCTACGHWNKEYDSERIKCHNCGILFDTNNDTRELADEVIGICKAHKRARTDIDALLFGLNDFLRDK